MAGLETENYRRTEGNSTVYISKHDKPDVCSPKRKGNQVGGSRIPAGDLSATDDVGISEISSMEELRKFEDDAALSGFKSRITYTPADSLMALDVPDEKLVKNSNVADVTVVFNDLLSKDIRKMDFYELVTYGCLQNYLTQEQRRQILSMQRGIMNMIGFDLAQKVWEQARESADSSYLSAIYNNAADFAKSMCDLIGAAVDTVGSFLGDKSEKKPNPGSADAGVIGNTSVQGKPAPGQQPQNNPDAPANSSEAAQPDKTHKDWNKLYGDFEKLYEDQKAGDKKRHVSGLISASIRTSGAAAAFVLKIFGATEEQKAAYIRAEQGLTEELKKFMDSVNQGISESIRTASDNEQKDVDMILKIIEGKMQAATYIIRNT
ncbi:MAG: hypothetical protein LBI61_01565 [Puniceicoccales bacterium]|jgi:hypothetical protein|nr:hypothetical protein [Puniceicoccales bacterium]